jgi:hypothetical protein
MNVIEAAGERRSSYEALFLVDTGATDSMAPASELLKVRIQPIGRSS